MSARSRFNKKSAPEIQPEINAEVESTEIESTETAEVEFTEEIESPVGITGAPEVTDQGEPGIVPDSDAQIDPISEAVTNPEAEAEVNDPVVNDPAEATDPHPESTPNEGDGGTTTADNAPVEPAPVSQGTDAPVAPTSGGRDPRLPAVGSTITRKYKDRELSVTVLDHGFEFEGAVYKSLSKLAGIISGQTCNGFAFFRLTGPTGAASAKTPKATRQASNPSGDRLQASISKIDALIVKLRAALDEGARALAEAEAKRAEIVGTAEPAQQAE